MAINPMQLLKMRERMNLFNQAHPRVQPFLAAVGAEAIREGAVLEMKVTSPEGKEYITNIRLNADDIETINMLKSTQ